MQTAIDQFRDNIARVKYLQAIHSSFSAITTNVLDLSDLLRLQIVMSVSALDQYIHEIVRIGMIEVFEGRRPQPSGFLKFSVSMDRVLQSIIIGDSSWLDNEIRTRHGYLAFQQPDKIADAVRYISSIELWNEVGNLLGLPSADVKSQLRLIVDRRNKIAHEADLDPSFPNIHWPITPVLAQDTVHFIEMLCEAIHSSVV